jgi:hypothetical protein
VLIRLDLIDHEIGGDLAREAALAASWNEPDGDRALVAGVNQSGLVEVERDGHAETAWHGSFANNCRLRQVLADYLELGLYFFLAGTGGVVAVASPCTSLENLKHLPSDAQADEVSQPQTVGEEELSISVLFFWLSVRLNWSCPGLDGVSGFTTHHELFHHSEPRLLRFSNPALQMR